MTLNFPERIEIPVITLPNIVFFPGTSLPLYVVDDIFQDIFEEATCAGNPVGISLAMEKDFETYFAYPCEVFGIGQPLMIERVDGNTLKVLVRCIGKCQVNYPTQSNPYPMYNVTILKDDECVMSNIDEFYRLESILYNWLDINIPNDQDRDYFIETLNKPDQIINYVATFIIKSRQIRQLLLEQDNINDKIKILNSLITDEHIFHEDPIVAQAFEEFVSEKLQLKQAN
ncbi:LON peptidase substrate-binding domain-containing protein [Halobacteriovorax sp. HFRX-2_2]|uniref:LON peptidase substrate-binding domain-containing protein n=1 Tax=unclassified Halobacteriovorax TaxID=2639665 RepID=UPI003714E915